MVYFATKFKLKTSPSGEVFNLIELFCGGVSEMFTSFHTASANLLTLAVGHFCPLQINLGSYFPGWVEFRRANSV